MDQDSSAVENGQTAEQMNKQFTEQGYLILKKFLLPDVVAAAVEAMETLVDAAAIKLKEAGSVTDLLAAEPFETRLYKLYKDHLDQAPLSFRKELHLPGIFGLFFDAKLLNVVESMIGGEIRLYPNYTARPKLPDWVGTRVLWHQDAGYTENMKVDENASVEVLRMVNIWTPLVPATKENGCMQFIPGTHKLGVVPHETRQFYLQIAEAYLAPRLVYAIDVELDPGDIVLFNNLLFHQGQPNQSAQIRWSIDWRYQDAGQATNRVDQGHIARSRLHPEDAVQSAGQWTRAGWK